MKKPTFTMVALSLSLVLTSLLFFSFGSYHNQRSKVEGDGKYYYHYLISLVYDHDLDLSNDYRRPKPGFMDLSLDPYQLRDKLTPTGKPYNYWTLGPALLWLPFFAVAYALGAMLNVFGLTAINLTDGWSLYFQYAVVFAAVIYSHVGLWMVSTVLRSRFSERTAVIASLLILWTTNLSYYVFLEASLSHAYDFFAVVLFIFVGQRARTRRSNWAYFAWGISGALAVLVRTQNILVVGTVTLYFALREVNQKRRLDGKIIISYVAFVVALAIGLTPLLYQNLYLYGSMLTIPQGENWMNWTTPHLWDVLFSERNGLFPYSPILLLGVIGNLRLIWRCRSERQLVGEMLIPLTLMVVAQWYVNSAARDWWAGYSYGMRRMISTYLWFALGLATFLDYRRELLPDKLLWLPRPGDMLAGVGALALIALNFYFIILTVFVWDFPQPHLTYYYLVSRPLERLHSLGDKIPPNGDFVDPPPDSSIKAPVRLRIEASDNPGGAGVDRVCFTTNATGQWRGIPINGQAQTTNCIMIPPYEVLWDMTDVTVDRPFEIGAEIYDHNGNRTDRVRRITRQGG